ncbi:hypothetical protein AMELA_G00147170 [Ameiurus melas]|uniref:Mitochondrial import inner membrane translocase subunit n=1 Tax=Ameiurus melas TaxID=219545 RepID=A0A7J6AGI7_AMEME|nr:hypothetical protein AMELA_G00147170 [Ameiurus melas]
MVMDPDGQLRNLRDFLLVYNRMTEICFQRCTNNFNYRTLTMDEYASYGPTPNGGDGKQSCRSCKGNRSSRLSGASRWRFKFIRFPIHPHNIYSCHTFTRCADTHICCRTGRDGSYPWHNSICSITVYK